VDGLEALLFARGLERVAIVLGGITAIVLGALLFRWGVSGAASLKVQHDQLKVQLLNAAPGVFFAFFGAGVLLWGLNNPLDYQLPAAETGGEGAAYQGLQLTYGASRQAINSLLDDLLRLDPGMAEPRLKAQLEQIQVRARTLRRALDDAE